MDSRSASGRARPASGVRAASICAVSCRPSEEARSGTSVARLRVSAGSARTSYNSGSGAWMNFHRLSRTPRSAAHPKLRSASSDSRYAGSSGMSRPSSAGRSERPSRPPGAATPARSSTVGMMSTLRATTADTYPARTRGPSITRGTRSVES